MIFDAASESKGLPFCKIGNSNRKKTKINILQIFTFQSFMNILVYFRKNRSICVYVHVCAYMCVCADTNVRRRLLVQGLTDFNDTENNRFLLMGKRVD